MEVNLVQINNHVALNELTLNISNTSKAALNFDQGEILKGQVQGIKENGLVSISLKGKTIDVLSTVELVKGQQIFLMVDDMRDGKVILKILTSDMLNKMENSNLANTLKEMNLPAHDKNLQMAGKLIQHNLPVTPENIKIISKGVNLLNGIGPRNLELVGLTMAKGAPITLQTLESLVQFVDGKSNLASLTKETVSLLDQIENKMTASAGLQVVATTNIQPKSSNAVFQLLKQLIETLTLSVNQTSASDLTNGITQAIKTNLTNENDLVRGLSLVKDILEQKEMPGIPKNLINPLIDKLDEMVKELAGQKLSNVMSRFSADDNLNFYYLSFPVKVENQYRLSQFKISKNTGNKSLADMDNIEFIVSLDTSNLGLVQFNVECHKSVSIKIEGIVENETVLKHVENNIEKLIKTLESHNYVVDYNGTKVSANEGEEMRLKLEERTDVVEPFEIDVWG